MYSVSSLFVLFAGEKNARPMRQFYIGDSNYSHYVTKWPSLKKRWDDLRPQTAIVEVANGDGTFNFILSEPVKMRSASQLRYGVNYPIAVAGAEWGASEWNDGSEYYATDNETVRIFAGTIDSVRYSGASASLTLVDKFKLMSERKIGDSTTPAAYTSSAYLVHDLAWYVCSSLAGLSSIASTSNPDIDYQSWASWSSVFSADNVRMKASFTGQNPLEALKKIGVLTQSAIFIEDDKIKFVRFSLVGSDSMELNDENIVDLSASIDDRNLINKAYVSAAYDASSRQFSINVSQQSSGSIAENGIREKLFAENFVWLTDSVSALNLAQRVINTNSAYRSALTVRVPANKSTAITIGDTIAVVDQQLGISTSMRIMGEGMDMDSGAKIFDVDQTQYSNAFTLDVSVLDGNDVLL